MEEKYVKLEKIPFLFYTILLPIIGMGALAGLLRFVVGLAPTNMNDGYPWGIWIAYDVVVGTALGTGGYVMAILIYLFNRWHYHPLIRSAVLTSVFGYSLAGVSVIVDLGRWWNMWQLFNPLNYNHNSVLLEVALCIMGYTVVTMIEFAPAVLEEVEARGWFQRFFKTFNTHKKAWNNFLIFMIALGILLPTMHQSSLGTMMAIAVTKVHPLWHTPFMPLLFIISIFYMGYSVVVAESFASSRLLKRPNETDILLKITPIVANIALVWFILRIVQLLFEGKMLYMFSSGTYSILFGVEMIMTLIAIIMLKLVKTGDHLGRLFTGAILLLLVGSLYRFNAYLIGYEPGNGFTYIPSLLELAVTGAIIATELFLYLVCVKFLPVLPDVEHA